MPQRQLVRVISVLGERPLRCFPHNRIRFVGGAVHQSGFGQFQAGVAKRDRDVAAEALELRPQDRGVGEVRFEFHFSEQKQLEQVRMRLKVLGLIKEGGDVRCFLVGGADGLAGVTAKDALTKQRAKSMRDGSTVLYREIGKAAPGVDRAVWQDRLGGASHLAAVTIGAIRVDEGFVWFEGQADQEFAKKQPGTVSWGSEERISRDPP